MKNIPDSLKKLKTHTVNDRRGAKGGLLTQGWAQDHSRQQEPPPTCSAALGGDVLPPMAPHTHRHGALGGRQLSLN